MKRMTYSRCLEPNGTAPTELTEEVSLITAYADVDLDYEGGFLAADASPIFSMRGLPVTSEMPATKASIRRSFSFVAKRKPSTR